MKILILGSGAREYAIGSALKDENKDIKLFFAPGNGATLALGENINLKDSKVLASWASEKDIELCIVGSEDFLAQGVVDEFRAKNLQIFGPTKAAAMLESSKSFMKSFLKRHKIKTAKFLNTADLDKAKAFINTLTAPIVIKADGLCAGKGVIIAKSCDEAIVAATDMLSGKSFGEAGKIIVIEEFLKGFELSVFAVCDGENFILLPAAQDHKRLKDKDEGPNTGGMGAYAPSALADTALLKKVENDIVKPTLKGMKAEDAEFSGVLFIGLMVVENKPFVLEFNVRFGDPECEVLMPLIENPLELFLATAQKRLSTAKIKIKNAFALGVVCASENYPYKASEKVPFKLRFDSKKMPENLKKTRLYYAGVSLENGVLYASGGRICVCVGLGKSLEEAKQRAYALCQAVDFKGMQYRKDIGHWLAK